MDAEIREILGEYCHLWRLLGVHLFGLAAEDVERFIEMAGPFGKYADLILCETPQTSLLSATIPLDGPHGIAYPKRGALIDRLDEAIHHEVILQECTSAAFDWSLAVQRVSARVPEFLELVKHMKMPAYDTPPDSEDGGEES